LKNTSTLLLQFYINYNINIIKIKKIMTCFLLPHTISNNLYETTTLPISISLNEYLNKLPPRDSTPMFSSYKPKTPFFFIMAELLQLHKLTITNSLHIGTRSCIEYLDYIHHEHAVHITDAPFGKFSLIVDDTESLNIDVLKYQHLQGTYISKMNCSTTPESIQFLYKLCASYKQVYLCKPEADSPTKSTRYVIALHFLVLPDIHNLKIPYYFRIKLDDINFTFGQTQMDHLRFVDFSKLKNIEWCLKYSIPI